MKRVTIIPKKRAVSLIPGVCDRESLCYYLSDDYVHFIDLRNELAKKEVVVENLAGFFQEVFKEIKDPLLEVFVKLNKENSSFEWWGGQIASRNPASTPLVLHIVYLFFAKKVLFSSAKDIVFVLESDGLSECISYAAKKAGYEVVSYSSKIKRHLNGVRLWIYYMLQSIYFFYQAFQRRRAAFRLPKAISQKRSAGAQRFVIRSWVTKGNFSESGNFADRNFGILPKWLASKGYEVITLPTFFNLSLSIKEVYSLMKVCERSFLIPEHYLTLSDYFELLCSGYRMVRRRISEVRIDEMNLAPIFNEVIKKAGISPSLLLMQIVRPMLKRLREMGVEIDAFYYAFESNAIEKHFLLSCREYYPDSEIVGFQHTTFYTNQLAYFLGPDEASFHPLPDKIVCSGPKYMDLHEMAGFPAQILRDGPNLRFESVYLDKLGIKHFESRDDKMVMLPLTFNYDLALDLFVKVKDAFMDFDSYKVYVRSHPLLSKQTIGGLLTKIGMKNYRFADGGIIQDWFSQMYAVISTGGSITILEAVAAGTPVIRVVPDNTFYYDPFWSKYPLKPVNSASEIKEQLLLINEIYSNDKTFFNKIAKEVLSDYFTRPTEENLKVFL